MSETYITDIMFWDSSNPSDYGIQNISSWTVAQVEKLFRIEKTLGRLEHKFINGYPCHCPWCGVIVRLLPYPHSDGICRYCQREMLEEKI